MASLFRLKLHINLGGIQTGMIKVEVEHTDYKTTITTAHI